MLQLDLKLVSLEKKYCVLDTVDIDVLQEFIYKSFHLDFDKYYLKQTCGKVVIKNEDLKGWIQVVPRLVGGKGGFGSMLRAIGAQIEKTTNREACRDLSGRRLRDINEEQRLKKWISQQAEREREIEERKKRKLEKLCSEPKIEFKDEAYEASRADLTERVSSSLEEGLLAVSKKRPIEESQRPIKKRKLLLDSDSDSTSSEDSEADTQEKCEKQKEVQK